MTTAGDIECPWCGSVPQWLSKQAGGRDGAFELPLRAYGCGNPLCAIRPHTEWENRAQFDERADKWGRVDPDGKAHREAWRPSL